MDDRRESRIPRPGFGSGAVARPLAVVNSTVQPTATLDRKRKAEGSLETITDNKRQTMAAVQGGPRPTRSATTGNPLRSGPAASAATSTRTGPGQSGPSLPATSELGPINEETWDDIRDKTGQTIDAVLSKGPKFAKGTKPERKVETLVPLYREAKALAKHLHLDNKKLVLDNEQWQQTYEQKAAEQEEEKRQWNQKMEQTAQQIQEIQQLLAAKAQNIQELADALNASEEKLVASNAALITKERRCDDLESEVKRKQEQICELMDKLKDKEEEVRSQQKYTIDLQTYNTSLQADLTGEKARHADLQRSFAELQGQVAEIGGRLRSEQQQLAYEREQANKMREERETAARDVATLRADLENTRQERDRAMAEIAKAKEDLERVRAAGGKSLEAFEALNNDKATMETQLSMQQKLILSMREELAKEKSGRAEADATAQSRGTQLSEFSAQIESLQAALADAERRVYEGELVRRKLHNIIQDLKGNIRVYCRVRPVSAAEIADAAHDSTLSVDFPTSGDLLGRGLTVAASGTSAGQGAQKHAFAFDRVFSPGTSQQAVFDEVSELVQSALDGHRVCIFAYGQTGSGKTFTMLGNRENLGVIPRAMHQIFECGQKLAAQDWQYNMQASMLEIYNEEIRDLLSRKKDENKKHQVSHDPNGVTSVSDLTLVDVTRPEAVDQLLAQAMDKRSVGCTALNEQSSRSHMVFTLRIDGHNTATGVKVSGVLNLIDLAGSERVKESGATGQRLKEAQAINKSLSALGDVIMAIANKQEHIPFRNSKLTYLLQPCLGGDAKTLMFLNVAPTREFANESLCSLRFGAKVNACEINAPKKNVVVPRA